MVAWMPDVEQLWSATRSQYACYVHPWFDVIGKIKDNLTSGAEADIDDKLERQAFAEEEPDPPDNEERREDLEWVTDDDDAPCEDEDMAAHEGAE
jgi:hypothetical protein